MKWAKNGKAAEGRGSMGESERGMESILSSVIELDLFRKWTRWGSRWKEHAKRCSRG